MRLKKEQSEGFVKAWNESREEYRLIREMISLRKAEKIVRKRMTNEIVFIGDL